MLEDILHKFVNIWFDYISNSAEFTNECKASLRQGCAILYERLLSTKWERLLHRTLPKILSQLSFFIEAGKNGATPEEIIKKLPKEVSFYVGQLGLLSVWRLFGGSIFDLNWKNSRKLSI